MGSSGIDWLQNKIQGLKATLMMIVSQFLIAGSSISYKLVSYDGMNVIILIAYRYLLASVLIFPLALFLERNKRPKLTWSILFQAFLCSFIGGPIAQNLYAQSIVLTSATFATAFINLVPPFTFIIAVLFGLERVEIGKMAGKAKVIGTLIGVVGAMLLTFYKGPELKTPSTHLNLLHGGQRMAGHVAATHKASIYHVIGSILALASSLCAAIGLTLQTKMSVRYPCHYSSTFLLCVMSSIQSVVFALCTERSWNQWKLGWNVRLFSVLFAGISSSSMTVLIMACILLRGPVFVASFNPLMLVIVAMAGFLVLDEKLHMGSVLGSVIIIAGLYMVLWGKSKEIERLSKLMPSTCSKAANDVSSTTIDNTTLEAVYMAHSADEDSNNLPMKSTSGKYKEKEIVEE